MKQLLKFLMPPALLLSFPGQATLILLCTLQCFLELCNILVLLMKLLLLQLRAGLALTQNSLEVGLTGT